MTNNEIIEMAINGHSSTRDAIRWAIEFVQEQIRFDGIHTCHDKCERPVCVAVREAVIAEREACAKVAEERKDIGDATGIEREIEFWNVAVKSCAEHIRARGHK